MNSIDLKIDVTKEAGLGEAAHIALTVTLPDPVALASPPIVCFAKPGGGYSRGYFTVDLPGPARGAQADWHAKRGWIFVSVDHLGVGDSSLHEAKKLDYTTTAVASMAAETEVLKRLVNGHLAEGFPAIAEPVKIGVGQSMGGCIMIVQQGRYHCYDGIAVLGYSPIHTHPPVRPGAKPVVYPWLPRDTLLSAQPMVIINADAYAAWMETNSSAPIFEEEPPLLWGFHYYEDYEEDMYQAAAMDLRRLDYADPTKRPADFVCQPWGSLTFPGAVGLGCVTPGAVASEAAAVTVPVFVGLGERDTTADIMGEPRAYMSSNSIDIFVCPRMGHMHNFAGTRELFWERIERFGDWAAYVKAKAYPGFDHLSAR